MKKRIATLAFLAAAMSAATSSWAFTSVAKSTFTAGTLTGGALIANVTIHVRDNVAPFGADKSSVTWSGVGIGTSWKVADRFLLLNATVTDVGGGIRVYTDNTNAAYSGPFFQDPTAGDKTNGDSMAAGLVAGLAGQTSQLTPLPMAWSIKGASATVGTDLLAADPNNGPAAGAGNRFQWIFMKDAYNTSAIPSLNFNTPFGNAGASLTDSEVINSAGIQGAQASFFAFPDGQNTFLYFQSDFTSAAAQSQYQTGALTIESFTH